MPNSLVIQGISTLKTNFINIKIKTKIKNKMKIFTNIKIKNLHQLKIK